MWIEQELYDKITQVMPIPATSIVVFWGDRILFCKKRIPPLAGYWQLPGGRINLGETPMQAASRELKEETGIDTDGFIELKTATFFHKEREDISINFMVVVISPEVKLNYEHSEYIWAPLDNLPYPIDGVTLEVVKDAVVRRCKNGLER